MTYFDLTDFEWSVIEPLLPNKVRGKFKCSKDSTSDWVKLGARVASKRGYWRHPVGAVTQTTQLSDDPRVVQPAAARRSKTLWYFGGER